MNTLDDAYEALDARKPEERLQALFYLTRREVVDDIDEAIHPRLLELLDDDDDSVCEEATTLLGCWLTLPTALAPIISLLLGERSDTAKGQCVTALEMLAAAHAEERELITRALARFILDRPRDRDDELWRSAYMLFIRLTPDEPDHDPELSAVKRWAEVRRPPSSLRRAGVDLNAPSAPALERNELGTGQSTWRRSRRR